MNTPDNQKRENIYHCSVVHEGFISAVSLLNDLMKILVGLGIFTRVTYFKTLGSDYYCKQTSICWLKYKLRGFYDFTLRNIAIGQNHIYRKQMEKRFFPKIRHFCTAKTVANREKARGFSDSAPSI